MYAVALDIAMMTYYIQSWPIDLYVVLVCGIPIILNFIWLLVSYEHKLKSIEDYNYLTALFVVLGIFGFFQFGMLVFFLITMFSGGLSDTGSTSYAMGAMWVTENLFLSLVFLLNILQLYGFGKHVHLYRKFCKDRLVFHKE